MTREVWSTSEIDRLATASGRKLALAFSNIGPPPLDQVAKRRTRRRFLAGLMSVGLASGAVWGALTYLDPGELRVPDDLTGSAPPADMEIVFAPVSEASGEFVRLNLEFPDGSSTKVLWPSALAIDTASFRGSVAIIGPDGADGEVHLIHGGAAEATGSLGPAEVLEELTTPENRPAQLWSIEDLPGFRAITVGFGTWSALVIIPQNEDLIDTWINGLVGFVSQHGYPVIRPNPPLVAIPSSAPGSLSRLEVDFSSGSASFTPGVCEPGVISPLSANVDYVEWCDRSGLLRIAIASSVPIMEVIYDELVVESIELN